jgi:hypothetical protein
MVSAVPPSKVWVYGDSLAVTGFESCRGHGRLSLVSVVCCEVRVTASGWSLVQRSPIDRGSRCVWSRNVKHEEAIVRTRPQSHGKNNNTRQVTLCTETGGSYRKACMWKLFLPETQFQGVINKVRRVCGICSTWNIRMATIMCCKLWYRKTGV